MSETVQRPPLSRRTAVLWALAAGAALLGAGAQTWVQASGLSGLGGTTVATTGNDAAAVIPAMALVGMAAGAALSIARRVGRIIIGVVLLLAGTAGGFSAVNAATHPAAAAATVVGEATGTTAEAASYTVTAWPWVGLVVSVLLALCGLAVLIIGRRWTDTNRRYDAAATATATAGTSAAGSSAGGQSSPSALDDEPEEDLDEIDAWDQLSRGSDPT